MDPAIVAVEMGLWGKTSVNINMLEIFQGLDQSSHTCIHVTTPEARRSEGREHHLTRNNFETRAQRRF